MFYTFFNFFVKITGWPIQFLLYRTKIYYENKSIQSRKIKGKAIVICNHTSVFDYPALMFAFFFRTLRVQMAEILFKKPFLGVFLKLLGGIYVDRYSSDLSFMGKTEKILHKGGVVGIWPEGRIPKKGEERPLEFKTGAAFLSLSTAAPVIPVYTDGSYFNLRRRAHIIIGTPLYPEDFSDENLCEKENIVRMTAAMREKIISLGSVLNERKQSENKS